jgi:hypothetical protein
MKKAAAGSGFLDRPAARVTINAFLFLANFLLTYFLWLIAFPGIEGLTRVVLCWGLAYAFTWFIVRQARGAGRLLITLLFLALLAFVLLSGPPA